MALIQLRRDTAANWTTVNPILQAGEPGLETDTGKLKIGDGNVSWIGLPYQASTHLGSISEVDGSAILTTGATMAVDNVKVQIAVANTTQINVLVNYADPDNPTSIMINGQNTNILSGMGGKVVAVPNDTTYYNITPLTSLSVPGDTVQALIVDNSFHRVYRITAVYRDVPTEGSLASAYCVIETLKK